MIGKFVVIDTLNNFNAMQGQIPSSAIVFIKDVGQIYAHGTHFGAQKTYNVLTQTEAGLAPKGGTSTSLQISDVSTEWVLTVTSGKNPSWRKLPANAFNDTKYTASNNGISLSDKTFSLALNSTTKLDSTIGEKIYAVSLDKNGKLCVSVPWQNDNTTYNVVSSSEDGLAPILPTSVNTTIGTQATEWVLTSTSGGTPTWRKLPSNAFKNTWTAWVGATDSKAGTAGYMPAPTTAQKSQFLRGDGQWVSLNNYSLPKATDGALGGIKVGSVSTSAFSDFDGKYYKVNIDKNGLAYVNVPWENDIYTLPTASNTTLGGVKTGAAISDTTGYTAISIKDGVLYYKDTNSNTWRGIYVGGASKVGTATNTKAINFAAGSNISITHLAAGTGSGQSGSADYSTIKIANTYSYTLPTASADILGGVKVGGAITSTSGYEAVQIKDGVLYAKNTTYTSLKNPNSLTLKYGASGSLTQAWTYDGSSGKTLSLIQGSNISITGDNSGNITIANTYSYTLPTAAKDTLGGVKTSSTVTSTSGYTACPIISGIVYYKNTEYSTKAMKVNGADYNIYTSSNSLPTLYAPTSLGSAGQVLKVNSDGTGLTWGTDEKNDNTWRPVKLTSSSGDTDVAVDTSTTLKFKAGSNMSLTASGGVITVATTTDTITATTFNGNASSATKWGTYKISVTSSPGTATDTIYFVT